LTKKEAAAETAVAPGDQPPARKFALKAPPPSLIIGAVVTLIVAGIIYVILSLNGASLAASEKIASETLGTKVTIGRLDISLRDKIVSIGNIVVNNPAGYPARPAITIGNVLVRIGGIGFGHLTFDKVAVADTLINLDVAATGTNLSALQENMGKKLTLLRQKDAQNGLRRITIRSLGYDTIQMARHAAVSELATGTLSLPPPRLPGIGLTENGVTASDALAQALSPVIRSALMAALKQEYLQGLSPAGIATVSNAMKTP
jgi:hypothetical protein